MGTGNGATAQQAVKLGELRMAQERIEQRIDSTIRTLNESEKLKLEAVRRTVEHALGLEKMSKVVVDLSLKVNAKILVVAQEQDEERAKLDAKQRADAEAFKKAKADELQAHVTKYAEKKAKIKSDLDEKQAELEELKLKIEKQIGDDGADIKVKAAGIRAHLEQEKSRLNDKIYATILPDNLRAVVDEAPKMGEEGKFVSLEFKK